MTKHKDPQEDNEEMIRESNKTEELIKLEKFLMDISKYFRAEKNKEHLNRKAVEK